MSIDLLIRDIEQIINSIMQAHPAVARVIIVDFQGMTIAQKYKAYHYDPKEEKNPNPAIPLLNSILENAEKFLKFLKNAPNDVFIFSWMFEKQYIFGASSPFGFIGTFCEPDIDIGWMKRVLKEEAKKYNELMRPLFVA